MAHRMTNLRRTQTDFEERVLEIQRVAKVVQGGRRFSFRASVVLGDKQGKIGFGLGKANEVTSAVAKAVIDAKRNMFQFHRDDTTIPHETFVKFKGVKILLKPARKGTGVIAGGAVRAFAECGGIHDLLSKSLGSNTILNVARAMVVALKNLKRRPGAAISPNKDTRPAKPAEKKAPPAPEKLAALLDRAAERAAAAPAEAAPAPPAPSVAS